MRPTATTACTHVSGAVQVSPSAWGTWNSPRTLRLQGCLCHPVAGLRDSHVHPPAQHADRPHGRAVNKIAQESKNIWKLRVSGSTRGQLLRLLRSTAGCRGGTLWGGADSPTGSGLGQRPPLRCLPLAPPAGGACPGSPADVRRLRVYCGLGSPWEEETQGSAPWGACRRGSPS